MYKNAYIGYRRWEENPDQVLYEITSYGGLRRFSYEANHFMDYTFITASEIEKILSAETEDEQFKITEEIFNRNFDPKYENKNGKVTPEEERVIISKFFQHT